MLRVALRLLLLCLLVLFPQRAWGGLAPAAEARVFARDAETRVKGEKVQSVNCTYRKPLTTPQLHLGNPSAATKNVSTLSFRWKGRWWNDFGGPAGTYDMRARVWSPELAVFLSVDEFAYHDARSTLWGWPGQNPLKWSDPSGHFAFAIPLFGGAAGGAAGAGLGVVALPVAIGSLIVVEAGYLTYYGPQAAVDAYRYANPTIVQGPLGDRRGANSGIRVLAAAATAEGEEEEENASPDKPPTAEDCDKGTGKKPAKDAKPDTKHAGKDFNDPEVVLDHAESIGNRQRWDRKNGQPNRIESTKKSDQRADNLLRHIKRGSDFE